MISVLCKSDHYLHLAPTAPGCGASIFTLCLERWTKRELCREDSVFCPVCEKKWQEQQQEAQ